jgi:hypothetical protein
MRGDERREERRGMEWRGEERRGEEWSGEQRRREERMCTMARLFAMIFLIADIPCSYFSTNTY